MTSDKTGIIGCFQLDNENPMCEYPAHQVTVSRIGVLCAPDSGKFFGTPCISRKDISLQRLPRVSLQYFHIIPLLFPGHHQISTQRYLSSGITESITTVFANDPHINPIILTGTIRKHLTDTFLVLSNQISVSAIECL